MVSPVAVKAALGSDGQYSLPRVAIEATSASVWGNLEKNDTYKDYENA